MLCFDLKQRTSCDYMGDYVLDYVLARLADSPLFFMLS